MRGISMILVVFGHVLLYMGIGGEKTIMSAILMGFRMPLFFFVSGFFSFRLISWWTKAKVADILKRKVQAQVICTIVFLSLYEYAMDGRINIMNGFGGYWFTIALFQMYLMYMLFTYISRVIKINISLWLMVLVSLGGFCPSIVMYLPEFVQNNLCWINVLHYIQFFTIGLIGSKYRDELFKLVHTNWFITTIIVGWIICVMTWQSSWLQENVFPAYYLIRYVFTKYFALLTVIAFFHVNAEKLSDCSRSSKWLRFVGRRTLDIYMIHYFFLPDLNCLSQYLLNGNRIILQLIIALVITMAIVVMCLLMSSILRQSKTLEAWLFGVKTEKTSITNV